MSRKNQKMVDGKFTCSILIKNQGKERRMNKSAKKFSLRQWMSLCLIVIGIGLIIVTLGLNLYSSYKNDMEVQAFKQAYLNDSTERIDEQISDDESDQMNTSIDDSGVIAILRIPSIDCEEIVKDGSERWTLAKAIGHMDGTAYPGKIGNCVIAGHRNYNFGLYFNRLDEVKISDELILDTKDGTYTYQVTDIKIVEPEEVSVLDQTENATITLITCTPIYVATHRLIITGELVKTELRNYK